jgi:hypothetical protein
LLNIYETIKYIIDKGIAKRVIHVFGHSPLDEKIPGKEYRAKNLASMKTLKFSQLRKEMIQNDKFQY